MIHKEQLRSVCLGIKIIIDNIIVWKNITVHMMNKIFAAIVVLTFVVVHVAAEIPPYIHVCSRRDPNIDECIIKNIDNLKSKICEGMPELGVPPSEPMHIEKINIINSNSAHISMDDVYVTGLCDFVVNYFNLNLEKLHFDVDITFKRINLTGTYNLNVKLIMPISSKGPIYITTENVSAKAAIDLKTTNKDGKQYVYLSNMNLDLDIKGYDSDLSSFNSEEANQLQQISRTFLGQNQKEILEVFKPIIEEIVIQQILNFSNQIVKHFTYDELFPDKE